MKQKKTKAEKRKTAARWHEGAFVLQEADAQVASATTTTTRRSSDSVIFDQNRVRLVYKDIRTSLIATIVVSCLLAGAYAMMRF